MASSPEINQFNQQWRSSPQYTQILTGMGVDPSRPIRLSDSQRKQLQSQLEQQMGVTFPKGVEIDPAGNMNENEGFGKQAKRWGPIVAAAAVTMFGIPGTPIAGLLGGGGAAGSSLGGLYNAPVAGTSQGVSASLAGGGGMGWLDTALGLVGGGRGARDVAGLAGAWLQGAGRDAAANRGAQFEGQVDLERLLLQRQQLEAQSQRDHFDQSVAREAEGRASGTDAWKKLMQAQRTLSPGARPQLSPYSIAPRQATDMERQGADAMTQEVMARLTGGNPIQAPTQRAPIPMPQVDRGLLEPGRLERASNWLAPVLDRIGGNRAAPQGGPVAGGYGGGIQGGNTLPPGTRTPQTFLDPRKLGGSGYDGSGIGVQIDPVTGMRIPPRIGSTTPWGTY